MNETPIVKDIVLVGGGHAHVLVIRMWAMNPTLGLRLTLISPTTYTPYSGMLPGLIAGHYTFEECHIDLVKLCSWAGVRYIQAQVIGMNPDKNLLKIKDRPNIEYDLCSLNIGSTPNHDIEGSAEYATGIKPIGDFYQHWLKLQTLIKETSSNQPLKIAMIGGGYGGIEIILAIHHWLKKNALKADLRLIHRGNCLFKNSSQAQQKKILKIFSNANISVELNNNCERITATQLHTSKAVFDYDKVFYCTHASASTWLTQTKLELSDTGFIKVNDYLQSTSHDNVFAAGDISHIISNPRPKAGVYAVRMGPFLFKNMIQYSLNKTLRTYQPQTKFLSLSALGGKVAMGARAPFTLSGSWVWKLKDTIDRKFMRKFNELPPMVVHNHQSKQLHPFLEKELEKGNAEELAMRCGGCGGKVGSEVLSEVLCDLKVHEHEGVLTGLNKPDDAAVLKIPDGKLLVQSIDFLKTFIDDPYIFGQLSAHHALSDIYAMNGTPHSAQAMVQLPLAKEKIQVREMKQLLDGALAVLNDAGCSLVGGHTTEDANLNLGFNINGLCDGDNKLLKKNGCKAEQVIIVCKPLGVGSLFAAHNRAQAKGEDIYKALESMLLSNKDAAAIFYAHQANACTDITGFGLMGHLIEMLGNSDCGAQLYLNSIPQLSGALESMESGILSSLQKQNLRKEKAIINKDEFKTHHKYQLLFDPQTCGGLMAVLDADKAQVCIDELIACNYVQAVVIGKIVKGSGVKLSID